MSKRSLAETLVFVNLLFVSGLSVRACSGVHNRVRGCFGTVRVVFGYRSGYVRVLFGSWDFCHFELCAKKQNSEAFIGVILTLFYLFKPMISSVKGPVIW